jgi:hypothetical protein
MITPLLFFIGVFIMIFVVSMFIKSESFTDKKRKEVLTIPFDTIDDMGFVNPTDETTGDGVYEATGVDDAILYGYEGQESM